MSYDDRIKPKVTLLLKALQQEGRELELASKFSDESWIQGDEFETIIQFSLEMKDHKPHELLERLHAIYCAVERWLDTVESTENADNFTLPPLRLASSEPLNVGFERSDRNG